MPMKSSTTLRPERACRSGVLEMEPNREEPNLDGYRGASGFYPVKPSAMPTRTAFAWKGDRTGFGPDLSRS